MELLEDYDFDLQYHPGKANVVADALSRKGHAGLASLMCREWEMMDELGEFDLELAEEDDGAVLFTLNAQPALVKKVTNAQLSDEEVRFILDDVLSEGGLKGWKMGVDQGLRFQDRMFVPPNCRDEVLKEFHHSKFVVHPGGTKMYQDLKRHYWWKGMKNDVARFVCSCLICQQVKAEHHRPAGMLQPLPVAKWKWENMNIDFVMGLPW